MSALSLPEAAAELRRAVAALSQRSAIELGELVAAVTPERTAALAEKLERLGDAGDGATPAPGVDEDDLVTLDSWIRLADSATLHDDVAEAAERGRLADRLRAVRALVAPGDARLSTDPRDL